MYRAWQPGAHQKVYAGAGVAPVVRLPLEYPRVRRLVIRELQEEHAFVCHRKLSSPQVIQFLVSIKRVQEPERHLYHHQYRYRSKYYACSSSIGWLLFVIWMIPGSLSIYPSLCYSEEVRGRIRV